MEKSKLLFHKEYEEFYKMAEDNELFSDYCTKVYGMDCSQDGCSDKNQIDDLLLIAGIKPEYRVLDIGCGNGKLTEYIARRTGAQIYGFDYSEYGIKSAKERTKEMERISFEEGIIGEKNYPKESFDVVLAIDTIEYAKDKEEVVKQILTWLKPNGLFLCFHSEGQTMNSVENEESELVSLLEKCNLAHVAIDYTKKHYDFLTHKRAVTLQYKEEFLKHGLEFYYKCAISTTIEEEMSYEEFCKQNNRRLYLIRKEAQLLTGKGDTQKEDEWIEDVKIAQHTNENQTEKEALEAERLNHALRFRSPFRMNPARMNRFGLNAPTRMSNPMRRMNQNQRNRPN